MAVSSSGGGNRVSGISRVHSAQAVNVTNVSTGTGRYDPWGLRKLLKIHACVARKGALVYKKGGSRTDGWVNVGWVRLPWLFCPRPIGSAA